MLQLKQQIQAKPKTVFIQVWQSGSLQIYKFYIYIYIYKYWYT